ncbi:MAG: MBL fold metallo-hydrolase, partial [Enterobacterales bacterium]|nr:MBL fold metallo-hydrolase [Enterobacterales bacterium]
SYIDEAIALFAADSEIYIGSHHWPIWGQDKIADFLVKQRDLYKFIHDQTVRMMNQGYTPDEIADNLKLPESLATFISNRGYYGTVKHNAKAVYQYYMGWYDANPANLNPLPASDSASRYVTLMGGAEAVIQAAKEAFKNGEYEWSAELLNKVVFSQPDNLKARQDLAAAYQQMGFQAESGPWRNVYLTAAMELLQGAPEEGVDLKSFYEILLRTPVNKIFESMAVRIDAEAAEELPLTIRINFTDLDERYDLEISNGVLHHRRATSEQVAAELMLTQPLFVGMIVGTVGAKDTLFSDDLTVNGSMLDLARFFSLIDKPDGLFNIVEP